MARVRRKAQLVISLLSLVLWVARIAVVGLVVMLVLIGAAIGYVVIQVQQQAPEASATARRAEELVRAAIPPGTSAEQVGDYFAAIGANAGDRHPIDPEILPRSDTELVGATSRMSASVDQRTLAPGPLLFVCNKELYIQVYFDHAEHVQAVRFSRICL